MQIYFDNAATTPPLPNLSGNFFGNPSSPHSLGRAAERELFTARQFFAKTFKCNTSNIFFTSGGTESNNIALIGYALAHQRKNLTIMAQPWEHPSILQPLKYIKDNGLAEVLIAPYDNWNLCTTENRLAAISHVNHETGDINDISSIAKSLNNTKIMVDGVQGFCKEEIDLTPVDIYTFSAHKCHGPTGIGGLMSKTKLTPLLYGGDQEGTLRPGTENVQGIMAMVTAVQYIRENKTNHHSYVATIKAKLEELTQELPGIVINTAGNKLSPYILNMSFLGLKGETLVHLLSERSVYASMGAACRSRKNIKSTLEVMGFPPEVANSAVRFSFSHLNTLAEATTAKDIIIECVTRLRKMLGVKI